MHTRFCTFGANWYAQFIKFIKSALLVGYIQVVVTLTPSIVDANW